MSQNPKNDFISKIVFLEQNAVRKRPFSNLNTFKVGDIKNLIEIQKAAHKLAKHIGLDHLTFVVNYSDLGNNIGGNIELDNDDCVLINISTTILEFQECVLATLAHEIAHKYLHINKLTFKDNYENEIFTDLTAIYLGFGRIMLKGRYVEKLTKGYNYTQTSSQEVGYLNKRQLSFIYLTLNILYGINPVSAIKHISLSDISYMLGIRINYRIYCTTIKRYNIAKEKIIKERLKLAHLCNMTRHLASHSATDIKIDAYKIFHEISKLEERFEQSKLHNLTESIKSKRSRKLAFNMEYTDFENKITHIKKNTNAYIHFIKRSSNYKFNLIDSKITDFECPNCNKFLRSKSEKAGIVICPKCKFKFGAETKRITVKPEKYQ
jgi:hypothetical protein